MSERELMEAQVDALYIHDANGRLLRTNEPDPLPAPRFFLGRTYERNTWRLREDVSERPARELVRLADREPVGADLRSYPTFHEQYCALLRRDAEIQVIWAGPAYTFPSEIPPPAKVVRIGARNSLLLERGFGGADGFQQRAPCMAVVEDGMAVSVCFCSRISPRVAEAGVETLQGYRGRGYATRVVAAWARAVRERGRTPLYSTSWANVASQGVARRLGLSMYGVDYSIR